MRKVSWSRVLNASGSHVFLLRWCALSVGIIGLGSYDAAVGVHVYRNAPIEIALKEVEVLHGRLVDVLIELAFYIGAG